MIKNKISFLNIENSFYTLVRIKDNEGISITELQADEARKYIRENNLTKDYTDSDGSTYVSPDFKNEISKNYKLKRNLINLITELDNV